MEVAESISKSRYLLILMAFLINHLAAKKEHWDRQSYVLLLEDAKLRLHFYFFKKDTLNCKFLVHKNWENVSSGQ